ncbi:Uncharacterised protein [Mycobacteroides abscessus subsp. bolletii]|uniref:Uncharacterized protein n=1 Tax=Mycobacteroides abscessus subsp. bolletii TaxID=319705 RepID=A0A9Q7WKS5_9MYCO|nr:Uncharacterised protein [Mycobacteroides abscessus]SHY03636.1 Uncharacterised protein [Mycobacteroides abscessus subsp. bolletii]SLD39252.1 Uncharacterised protein [Mycobacteroides abscessus subsp. massiliense]
MYGPGRSRLDHAGVERAQDFQVLQRGARVGDAVVGKQGQAKVVALLGYVDGTHRVGVDDGEARGG